MARKPQHGTGRCRPKSSDRQSNFIYIGSLQTTKVSACSLHLSTSFLPLGKRRRGPVNVRGHVRRGALLDVRRAAAGVEQELVDVRREVGLLVARERAVVVVAGAGETHVVRDTERLVDQPTCLHARGRGHGA